MSQSCSRHPNLRKDLGEKFEISDYFVLAYFTNKQHLSETDTYPINFKNYFLVVKNNRMLYVGNFDLDITDLKNVLRKLSTEIKKTLVLVE